MNINEFLDKTSEEYDLEEANISADDIDRDFRILLGQESSSEIIDSAKKLRVILDKAKKGKLPTGMFRGDIRAKAEEVEAAMQGLEDDEIDYIVNKQDDKDLTANEKIIYNFASQAEEYMINFKKDKYLAKSDSGSISADTISKRSFNIIPVQFKLGDKYYYGISRAPEGIITWQRAIEKWSDMGLINADSEQIKKEYSDLEELPKKLPMMEVSSGQYKVDQTERVRELINDGKLDYDDTPEAKREMIETIIGIMQRNKKYQDMSQEEVEVLLTKHEVRTWAIDNVDFWKSVKETFDD